MENETNILDKIQNLPTDSGVYQYYDSKGIVIYVGKAKNLRSRIKSYFQEGRPKDPKTIALVNKIFDIEIIVTDSPVEALILEDTLIKKFKPRYNILLKDDKSFPFIRVTNEPFPKVFSTRRKIRDGSKYFGPYTDLKYMKYLLKTIRSIFQIRSCDLNLRKDLIEQNKFKICLDYHIGKCLGPCEAYQSSVEYNEMIIQVIRVLKGKTKDLENELEREMTYYSEALMFEKAAHSRDRLTKLKEYRGNQKVVVDDLTDRDIISYCSQDEDACAVILKIRDGRLTGKQHHYLTGVLEMPEEDILTSIIRRHYLTCEDVPEEILLPSEIEDVDLIERFLSDIRKEGKVKLVFPKQGDKQKLVSMAQTNAKFLLEDLKIQKMKVKDVIPKTLSSLQRDLFLDKPPRRIDCFDNSNFQGSEPVSSMVCFIDGKPKPSEYKKYKVKNVIGIDDFATMKETVFRRYKRVIDEGLSFPDLIVIDGGKGQVSSAMEAMLELGLEHIPLIGLAKRLEEIIVPGKDESLILPRTSSSLRLLQQIRDEAHRTAITFHRSLRDKRTLQTEFTNIDGVGPKTALKIFEKFGSVRGVQLALIQELKDMLGDKTGEAVFNYFKQKDETSNTIE